MVIPQVPNIRIFLPPWKPENARAWGSHVCDVYPPEIRVPSAPASLTCGVEDSERLAISRIFLYRYREYGGNLIWEIYPGGHELTRQVLALPQTWFDDLLPNKDICYHVEDDTGIILKF